ncbi:unnamed protein product [Rhizoctonia solani]|uniref:Uncharacterized protein n=1 Tax=Rhizoctonia solani TaxID=456999 RepID=A0A8H2WVI7_9AGAM|nr:unnamed protein product [Rhizoctonia solani]
MLRVIYPASNPIVLYGECGTLSGNTEQRPLDKGRTAAIVAACGPTVKDASSDSPRSMAEGTSHTVRRGRQPASQGSGGEPHPGSPPCEYSYKSQVERKNSENEVCLVERLSAVKKVGARMAREAGRSPAVDQEEKINANQELPDTTQLRPQSQPFATTYGPGAPLKASLFEPIRWFILIVAVNYGSVDDPGNDLGFWTTTLWDSTHQRVTFRGLSGARATLESIKKELKSMYSQACMIQGMGRSNLFVYFTGEGDGRGGMNLLDGTSIGRRDIELWLQDLQAEERLAQTPTVLFDMCRYGVNPNEPIVVIAADMNVIYSCFSGEGALAMAFGGETLFSAFSLAFVMASCGRAHPYNDLHKEPAVADPNSLKKAIQERLQQLTNVVNLARRSGWLPGVLHIIFSMSSKVSNVFKLPDLTPQSPDWGEARNLDPIVELSDMISKMKKNTPSKSSPDHNPPLQNHTTQHHRGAAPNILLARS